MGAPPTEQLAGGLAIAAAAKVASAEEALRDPRHRDVIEHAAVHLGHAMAALVNALDPALVVVGGGLGLAAAYRERFVSVARGQLWAPPRAQPKIVPAALGASGGVIGAALSLSAHHSRLSRHQE